MTSRKNVSDFPFPAEACQPPLDFGTPLLHPKGSLLEMGSVARGVMFPRKSFERRVEEPRIFVEVRAFGGR